MNIIPQQRPDRMSSPVYTYDLRFEEEVVTVQVQEQIQFYVLCIRT